MSFQFNSMQEQTFRNLYRIYLKAAKQLHDAEPLKGLDWQVRHTKYYKPVNQVIQEIK
jgi:hypothetical protein